MAIVYLAEDLKHHRKVAVKVLRPELSAALGPERFLREIEIEARLTHPHILPLYDSGEAGGFLYYVMPYIEGESLRDRLDREKQLPVEDALEITRDIAAALSHAHSHDVIHRDIKPENILLSGGEAVVADFGIARAVTEAGGEKLTGTGVSIGTPAYMSPEQATGSEDLDGRSDVYSLGCVLYEMLAGEAPFTGPTVESIVHQHLTASPAFVTARRPTVPAEVAEALEKALAKTPADRFSMATEFADALVVVGTAQRAGTRPVAGAARRRRSAIAYSGIAILAAIGAYTVISRTLGPPELAVAAETPKLAVLPFDNLGSPEDEYFADGITEEITSRIAEVSGLRVISRQSAIQYENSEKTLREIGEELSVDYVLEGTIRTDRAPDGSGQVRVTPQLIRVSDDAHLWTDRYTAALEPGQIFQVQSEIAEQVAGALDVTLLEPERQRMAARPTDNLEAYDYYLRGLDYHLRGAEQEDLQIASRMYERAIEQDPAFALAYARLSMVHSARWWYFQDRTEERLAMAKEAVDQALELDPDLPEAHSAMGFYYYRGHLDYDRALAEFLVAQESQPNSSSLYAAISYVQRRQGKFEQALANGQRAVELDPRSAITANNLAHTHYLLRDPVEAGRFYDRAISLSPDWFEPFGQKARWLCLRLEGSTERARAVLEEARGLVPSDNAMLTYSWIVLEIWDGNYQVALDLLGRASSQVMIDYQFGYVPKAQLYAQVYGLMGNRELEQVYYDSARIDLETRVREQPDDARYRSALGIALAGLGRKDDAIREGELAVELLPMSKEAWRGAYRMEQLARIYTMVGEYAAAIDRLEALLG
jgi:serine/threonine-protein kinase